MKKQWKRLAALSSAAVMAAGTLLYFPTDTLQNISWGITASAEETGTGTESGTQTWKEDNLTWTLTADGTMTISGEGAMKNYFNDSPACNNKNIKKVVIEDGITSIGASAFLGYRSLTSITIPSSVTSIGDFAFSDCTSLTNITIPESVTSIGDAAFFGCRSLTSIEIPSNVTSIGAYAFRSCTGLTSIEIPEGVTSIGDDAFLGCDKLTVNLENGSELTSENLGVDASKIRTYWNEDNLTWTLTADGTMTISGTGAMKDYFHDSPATQKKDIVKKVVIEEGVTSIGDYALFGYSSLTSIEIPESVTSIGIYAFCDCSSLTDITIPGSVTSIGDSTFSNCTGLTSIEIPSGVTSIGDHTFYGCSSLTSVTIPSSVTSIGSGVFDRCNKLTVNLEEGSTLTSGQLGVDASKIAAYWNEDNLTWTLTADGTMTISGTGPMRDYFHDSPATQKKDSVERVVIEDGVTSIGIFAFQYCRRLTNITIPESVTSIGDSAFRYCSSLTSITIPESVTSIGNAAFSDTPWLTNKQQGNSPVIVNGILIDGTACSGEVTIPEGVTSIGDFAFSGCSSMTSITIPDSVKSIGDFAFEWCTGLTSIEIPEGVTSIGKFVFFSCHKLTEVFLENGSKLTSGNLGVDESIIGTYWNEGDLTWTLTADGTLTISGTGAMKDYSYDSPACDNSNIKKVVIEEGVTSIGDSAFSDCRSLTDITIPGSVTSIGNGAFSGCSILTDIMIPSSVTSIGESAFESCTDLTSITIPKSVTSIGSNVFDGCTDLTEVLLEGGSTLTSENFGEVANKVVTRWNEDNLTWALDAEGTLTISGTGAMKEYGAGSSPAAQKKDSVKKIVIEDGITNIVDFAFFDCTVLESIEIPGSVASIGNFAFCSCSRLTDITILGSVTSIGDYAFLNCTGLTSINIPEGVTSIEDYAFQGCSSLTSITIPESVTSIGNYAFKYCSSLTDITIPGSVTSIGYNAFQDCTSLTSITIPKSVTSIGSDVFDGCTDLTEVLLEGSSTLTSESFGEVANKVVTRWNEDNLTWTLDADGTMTISGSGAMKDYGTENLSPAASKSSSVNRVVIQEGVTSIGKCAFEWCSSLTSIEIPESVKSIGDSAFSNCTGLTSINIPKSVTSIGIGVFDNCGKLPEITVPCDSALTKDAFGDASEKVKYRHSLVKTDAKDATYTEAGNVEYWTCENCKKHFLTDETDAEAAKEVELSEIVKPVPVQVATATTQIKCVYGQDMDEIDLQNYVKNANAVGEVSVKVATGSTMLDGMQLDGSKLSGKPAKVYTDGKDVTFTFTAKNGNTANLTLNFLVAKADPTVKVTVDGDSHTEGDLVEKLGLSISKDSTKGAAKIVSKLKKLIAGKNTLAWEFTPEDSENYNVVTGTVVVNAQTTTTTTTTTTATTTTTTTNETTSTTKETTATTKATTATSGTTATTKATATTNETAATTEASTVTTNETTATTEGTTATNETTATIEETTTKNETTATTEATTVTTSGTIATTDETTTNETTATTEATTTTSGTTSATVVTTATSGTTSATKATTATSETAATTKATTATSGTTSATKATTATSGTTATTSATQTTTITSASNTESTATTSATTITTAVTTSVTNIADEDLCSWAINDYQKKAGIVPANAEITARSEETCEITLTDENGNVLDVYTVDPKTGTGTDSSNAEVNLPQTGNNAMTNWLLCVGAAMFMAFGFGAVKASGIFKRKEDE